MEFIYRRRIAGRRLVEGGRCQRQLRELAVRAGAAARCQAAQVGVRRQVQALPRSTGLRRRPGPGDAGGHGAHPHVVANVVVKVVYGDGCVGFVGMVGRPIFGAGLLVLHLVERQRPLDYWLAPRNLQRLVARRHRHSLWSVVVLDGDRHRGVAAIVSCPRHDFYLNGLAWFDDVIAADRQL